MIGIFVKFVIRAMRNSVKVLLHQYRWRLTFHEMVATEWKEWSRRLAQDVFLDRSWRLSRLKAVSITLMRHLYLCLSLQLCRLVYVVNAAATVICPTSVFRPPKFLPMSVNIALLTRCRPTLSLLNLFFFYFERRSWSNLYSRYVIMVQKNWGSVRFEFFASTKTVSSVLFGSIWVRKTFVSFMSTDCTTSKMQCW